MLKKIVYSFVHFEILLINEIVRILISILLSFVFHLEFDNIVDILVENDADYNSEIEDEDEKILTAINEK